MKAKREMENGSNIAIIIAVISLIGTIVTPVVGGFLAQEERKRQEKRDYLLATVNSLVEVRSEMQYLISIELTLAAYRAATDPDEQKKILTRMRALYGNVDDASAHFRRIDELIGRTFAIMISSGDPLLIEKAPQLIADKRLSLEKVFGIVDVALRHLGSKLANA